MCVPYIYAGPQYPTEQHGNGDCKRQETEAPSSQMTSSSHLDLNFPLPGEKGPSCLVKVRCESSLTALFGDVSAVNLATSIQSSCTLRAVYESPTEVCLCAGV